MIFSYHKLNFRWCKIDITVDALKSEEVELFMELEQAIRTEEKNSTLRRYLYGRDLVNFPNKIEHYDDDEKLYVKKYEVQNRRGILSLEGYVDGSVLLILKTAKSENPRSELKLFCE